MSSSSKSMLDTIIRALVGVEPAYHGLILDIANRLGGQDAQSIRTRLAQALREPSVPTPLPAYLVNIASVTLAPTKGGVTISEANYVFSGYIDSNFKSWGTNVTGTDTVAQAVSVHEMSRDGTFAQHFNSLGDPRSLCLTQGQIVEFCRTYRDQLRQDGCSTFFLFEVKDKLFVALVLVHAGKLSVSVRRFGNNLVWLADGHYRLVVQQQ